ncbi:DUF6635 family protein [Thalassobaculum sp.]|uniref:DUF6635 family protein n=1 Tax=Thalassobaculum sp. TaxID=2022740 RepID=UPI0032EEEB56
MARRVVDASIDRWVAGRREAILPFIDRHFTFRGTARLHRHAFGWDVLRAPANIALVPPQLGLHAGGVVASRLGARRLGHWLASRRLLLRTDVDAEIEWLLWSEFLELPYSVGNRVSVRDSLAECMLGDPSLTAALAEPLAEIARHAGDPEIRKRIEETVAAYTGARAAAADVTGALINAGAGYLAAQQFTPSVWTLGPVLAAAIAQKAAVTGFPLGATLGSAWYGLFPAVVGPWAVVSTTVGLAAIGAVVSAFAGLVADPTQRALGIHRRRLDRMLRTIETNLRGNGPAAFAPRDHYAARLIEVVDMIRAAHRVVQGG